MKERYFSHDQNAMADNKIVDLRSLYHMEGYGVYWGVVEALSRESDMALPLTKRKMSAFSLSMQPSFDMMKFIQDCVVPDRRREILVGFPTPEDEGSRGHVEPEPGGGERALGAATEAKAGARAAARDGR